MNDGTPMPHVCVTCAAHVPGDVPPPATCPICDEPRQYLPVAGQKWTDLRSLANSHTNRVAQVEPDLWGVGVEPAFAIGQRALLVRTPEGNMLWDCIPLLTDEAYEQLDSVGGVRAIAISHPHYYTGMVDIAERFDATIHLHVADHQHVTLPSERIAFWDGDYQPLFGGLTLIRAGGHFAGGTVAHWPAGAEGRGVLLTGDIIMVIPDRRYVSFLYSYPNQIPLPVREVERVAAAVRPYGFDRIIGAWWDRIIPYGAAAVLERSVERYRLAISGRLDGVELPWPGRTE